MSEEKKEVCGDLLQEVYGVTRLLCKLLFLLPVTIFCKRGFWIIPQGRLRQDFRAPRYKLAFRF